MLSQNSTAFPGRHHRHNSTPTKFDNPKNISPVAHRRGLSSDQLAYTHQSFVLPQQNDMPTSVEYTLGQQLTQTATMRETQPQLMDRPGFDQQEMYEHSYHAQTLKEMPCPAHGTGAFSQNYLTTPIMEFDNQMPHSLQEAYNLNTMDFLRLDSTASAGNLDGFGNGLDGNIGNIQPNGIMKMKAMPQSIGSTSGSRPTSREGAQVPCTPPSQMRTSYFPMTPATTPYSQNTNIKRFSHSRTADSSPTRRDPNLTITASHAMQRGTSCQDNFTAMRQHAMSPDIPSPPNTAPLEPSNSVDLATFPQSNILNMSSLKMDMPLWEGGYNASNYSPMSNAVSSTMSSFQSSPEITHMSLFEPQNESIRNHLLASDLSSLPASQSTMDLESYSSPAKQDLHPRSQSMSQIDDLNECIEDTGVTCDEIAAFISYPDADNKWTCLYPGCGKKFGRKENIKSHVQTHLDDRQFRCRDCNKRFVRQHDLKRHANIHSGVRSYPCPCGKGFARHDALTRHRQRGMCFGAFEGTPKKVIKRGRPKKTRPDAEDRQEKSAATRQRALEKLEKRSPGKHASSVSDSSTSAYPSPEQFDSPPEQASSPPELDLSSSSPAAPQANEYDANLSQPLTTPLESSDDLFSQDEFDWPPPLEKADASLDMNDGSFEHYLNLDIEGALNDFGP